MTSAYSRFFERVPKQLLTGIGYGCNLGDKAYAQVLESDHDLLRSPYMHGLRSRIHDKAIQMYLHEKLGSSKLVSVYCKDTGFGNRIVTICGADFNITPCHVSERIALPQPAKYKLKACENNPGSDFDQLNLFNPPYAKEYKHVHFIVTTFFDSTKTIPTLVLPDNTFTTILDSKPIFTVTKSEEENNFQRRIPKLISEVEKQNEQLQKTK